MYFSKSILALAVFVAVPWTNAASAADQSVPVPAPAAVNPVATIAAAGGNGHGLALRSDGTVAGWGFNKDGQVGDGTAIDQYVAKTVQGLPPVKQIAADGGSSYALARDGSVWAWGSNYSVYDGERTGLYYSRSLPAKLEGFEDATTIAAAGYLGAALLQDGSVKVWYPYYVANSRAAGIRYLSLKGIPDVRSVVLDGSRAYTLSKDGTVRATELYNEYYGRYRTEAELRTETVTAGSGVKAIAVTDRTLFLLQGDGSVTRYDAVKRISAKAAGLDHIVAIATAYHQLLALRGDGSVWQWDFNAGAGLKPFKVKGLSHIVSVAGSSSNLHFAVQKGGELLSWGAGWYGELGRGIGNVAYDETPAEVLAPLVWTVNDHSVSFAGSASVYDDGLYVPQSSVFKSLGFEIGMSVSKPDPKLYNATFTTWTFSRQGKSLSIRASDPVEAYIDGKRVQDVPVLRWAADSTQFPLEFICRTFGIGMNWDRISGKVTLQS